VALVLSGGVGLGFMFGDDRDSAGRLEQAYARTAAERIASFIRENEELLQAAAAPIGKITADQRRTDFLRLLSLAPAVSEVSYLDATGREIIRIPRLELEGGRGLDLTQDSKFVVPHSGKTYVSPVYFRSESEPYMTIAVPEHVAADPGVVVVELNLKFVRDVVTGIRVGDTGLAYVVDDHGLLIAHPDLSLVLRKTDLSALPQVSAATTGTVTRGSPSAMTARDVGGRDVLAAFEPVPLTGWSVIVEQPLSEAYAPVVGAVLRSLALLAVGLLGAGVAAVVLARSFAGPIRTVRAAATRIGGGALDERIDLRTGDELEELAEEFNHMSQRLRESYASLERRVEDRTAELAVANAQLRAATAAKSQFLANMSHELRTPLNAIIGFSDVLLERMSGELNTKQAEYVRDILDSGKHQLSLINDILDLSKVEAGRMELSLSSVPLAETLESAMTLVRAQAVRCGIELTLAVDPTLTVTADERKVKQVVLNLLANAVKFTPTHGQVALSARRVDGAIEIAVRDTGPGISTADQARIFEEFAQARAKGAAAEGTGLGLTLAQKFVALHGGRIWVDSALGKGSTFTFTLPLRVVDDGVPGVAPAADIARTSAT
jgi:signal transduction histidine kinase